MADQEVKKHPDLDLLHQQLLKDQYAVPEDYAIFEKTFKDPANADALHKQLLEDNYAIPLDYNDFLYSFGLKKKEDPGEFGLPSAKVFEDMFAQVRKGKATEPQPEEGFPETASRPEVEESDLFATPKEKDKITGEDIFKSTLQFSIGNYLTKQRFDHLKKPELKLEEPKEGFKEKPIGQKIISEELGKDYFRTKAEAELTEIDKKLAALPKEEQSVGTILPTVGPYISKPIVSEERAKLLKEKDQLNMLLKTPSKLTYILGRAYNQTITGLADNIINGEARAPEEWLSKYDSDTMTDVTAMVLGFLLDMPAFGFGGKIGTAITKKAAAPFVKKIMENSAKKMIKVGIPEKLAGEFALKAAERTTMALQGMGSSSAALGSYSAVTDALGQWAVPDATFDDIRWSQVFKHGMESSVLGLGVGGLGIGASMLAQKASSIPGAVGRLSAKAAVKTGGLTAESALFTYGGAMLEGRGLKDVTKEDFLSTVAMLGMLKATHIVGKIPGAIEDPKKAAASFYKSVAYNQNKAGEGIFAVDLVPYEIESVGGKDYKSLVRKLAHDDAYLGTILQNENIPARLKQKLLWASRGTAMEGVNLYGDKITQNGVYVDMTNKEGVLVERKKFGTPEEAESFAIRNQAQLNDMKIQEKAASLPIEEKTKITEKLREAGFDDALLVSALEKPVSERTPEENKLVSKYYSFVPKGDIKPEDVIKEEIPDVIVVEPGKEVIVEKPEVKEEKKPEDVIEKPEIPEQPEAPVMPKKPAEPETPEQKETKELDTKEEVIEETETKVSNKLNKQKAIKSDKIFKEQKTRLLDDLIAAEDILLGQNKEQARKMEETLGDKDPEFVEKNIPDLYQHHIESLPKDIINQLKKRNIRVKDGKLVIDIFGDGSIQVGDIRAAMRIIDKGFPARLKERRYYEGPSKLRPSKYGEIAISYGSLEEAERRVKLAEENLAQAEKGGRKGVSKGLAKVMEEQLTEAKAIYEESKKIDFTRIKREKQIAEDKEFQALWNEFKDHFSYENVGKEKLYDIIERQGRPSDLDYDTVQPLVIKDRLESEKKTVEEKMSELKNELDDLENQLGKSFGRKDGKGLRQPKNKSEEWQLRSARNQIDRKRSELIGLQKYGKAVVKLQKPTIAEESKSETKKEVIAAPPKEPEGEPTLESLNERARKFGITDRNEGADIPTKILRWEEEFKPDVERIKKEFGTEAWEKLRADAVKIRQEQLGNAPGADLKDFIGGVGGKIAELQSREAKVDNYQRLLERYEKEPNQETKDKILKLEKDLEYPTSYFDLNPEVKKEPDKEQLKAEEKAIKKWLKDEGEDYISVDWDGEIVEIFKGRDERVQEYTKEELIEKGVEFPEIKEEKPKEAEIKPEVPKETPKTEDELFDIRPNAEDIPFETARRAHMNTSFDPDKRGRSEQQDYVDHINKVIDEMSKLATNPDQKATLKAEIQRYKEGYINKFKAYLDAASRTASTMITGSSNFPAERNRKALAAADNRMKELIAWDEKAQKAIKKALKGAQTPEEYKSEKWGSIKKNIDDNLATIIGIDKGEVKGYNRALFVSSLKGFIERMANNGQVEDVRMAIDYIRKVQEGLKKPIFTDRNEIWNAVSNAEFYAKRSEEKKQKGEVVVKEYDGAKVVNNYEAERVQITMDKKPTTDIINALKKEGWKWSPSNSAWQRQNTGNAVRSAESIMDKYFKPKTEKAPEAKPIKSFDDFVSNKREEWKKQFESTDQDFADSFSNDELKKQWREEVLKASEDKKQLPGEVLESFAKIFGREDYLSTFRGVREQEYNLKPAEKEIPKVGEMVKFTRGGKEWTSDVLHVYPDGRVDVDVFGRKTLNPEEYEIVKKPPSKPEGLPQRKEALGTRASKNRRWRDKNNRAGNTIKTETKQDAEAIGFGDQLPLSTKEDPAYGGSDLNNSMTLSQISRNLISNLKRKPGGGVRSGMIKRFLKNAAGVFFPDSGIVRIKGLKDFRVLSHELGHWLDFQIFDFRNVVGAKNLPEKYADVAAEIRSVGVKYKGRIYRDFDKIDRDTREIDKKTNLSRISIVKANKLKADLQPQLAAREVRLAQLRAKYGDDIVAGVLQRDYFKKELADFLADINYPMSARSKTEAIAEFVWNYIADPKKVEAELPKFHAWFEKMLDAAPPIKEALATARKEFKEYAELDPRARRYIENEKKDPWFEGLIKSWDPDKFLYSYVNHLQYMRNLSEEWKKVVGSNAVMFKDPYASAKAMMGIDGRAQQWLLYHPYFKRGKDIEIRTDIEGLVSVLKNHKLFQGSKKYDDYSDYLLAKDSLESYQNRKPQQAAMPLSDAKAKIDLYEKQYGVRELWDFQSKVQKYNEALLDFYAESGKISKEIIEKIKMEHQYYVPLRRVFEEFEKSKGVAGTGKDVLATSEKGMWSRVGSERQIRDIFSSMIENTYNILSASEHNIHNRNVRDALFDIQNYGLKESRGDKLLLKEDKSLIQFIENNNVIKPAFDVKTGEMTWVMTHQAPKGKILSVWEDGKIKYYDVDAETYNNLFQNEPKVNHLIRVMSMPSRWLQAGAVVFDPTFPVRNIGRDQVSAWFYSKYGYSPVDFAKGIFSSMKKDDMFQKWMASGADQSFLTAADKLLEKKYAERKIGRALDRKWQTYRKSPLLALQDFSRMSEMGTRVGAFKNAYKKTGDVYAAALESRDISADYGIHGAAMRSILPLYPFLNARLQHTRMMTEAIGRDPKKFFLKGLAITAPAIINWLSNNWDDEATKRYQSLPEWRRIGMFNIRIPGTDNYLPLPKGFLGMLFASTVESALDFAAKEDPRTAQSLARELFKDFSPISNVSEFIPFAIRPKVEMVMNKKAYTNKPIIPETLAMLKPEEQYYESTPEIFKKIGEFAGISPLKMDFYTRSYFGGAGIGAVNILDEILQAVGVVEQKPDDLFTTLSRMPFTKAFVTETPVGPYSSYVSDFYKKLDEMEKLNRSFNNHVMKEDFERLEKLMDNADNEELFTFYEGNKTAINKFRATMSGIRDLKIANLKNDMMTNVEARKENDRLDQIIHETAIRFRDTWEKFKDGGEGYFDFSKEMDDVIKNLKVDKAEVKESLKQQKLIYNPYWLMLREKDEKVWGLLKEFGGFKEIQQTRTISRGAEKIDLSLQQARRFNEKLTEEYGNAVKALIGTDPRSYKSKSENMQPGTDKTQLEHLYGVAWDQAMDRVVGTFKVE